MTYPVRVWEGETGGRDEMNVMVRSFWRIRLVGWSIGLEACLEKSSGWDAVPNKKKKTCWPAGH